MNPQTMVVIHAEKRISTTSNNNAPRQPKRFSSQDVEEFIFRFSCNKVDVKGRNNGDYNSDLG